MNLHQNISADEWSAQLHKQYFQPLCRLAQAQLSRVQCEHLAEDVAQEVLLQAHLQEQMLRSHENLKGWLYQTAFNLCRNIMRTQQRNAHRQAFSLNQSRIPDIEDHTAESSIYQCLEMPHTHEETIEYLQSQLSADEYQLFHKHYIAKLPVSELARCQGISASAMNMRLIRLRRKVTRLIKLFFLNCVI